MHAVARARLGVAIESQRLSIVPLGRQHARVLFSSMQDERIYQWISSSPPPSIEVLEADWQRVADRLLTSHEVLWLAWAIRRNSDGAWIGKMDTNIETDGVASNVGYLFFPPFWGLGYATEAVRALSAKLLQEGIVEQIATVTHGNVASMRVLEHAGFKQMRILPGNDMIRGVLVDDIEYRLPVAAQWLR